jgi:ABC-type antimicrobial peptide transport system permease subunit
VLPLFAVSAFAPEAYQEMAQIGAVGVLLALVAMGVFLFVFTGIRSDARNVLLQKEEYAPDRKKDKRIQVVAAIYWPCVTLIYLAWSFLTFNWGFTWIIWPIAGVLFGVIAAVLSAVGGKKE